MKFQGPKQIAFQDTSTLVDLRPSFTKKMNVTLTIFVMASPKVHQHSYILSEYCKQNINFLRQLVLVISQLKENVRQMDRIKPIYTLNFLSQGHENVHNYI